MARLPLSGVVDDGAITNGVEQLQWAENRTAAQKLRWIAKVDQRQTWRAEGHRSSSPSAAT